MSLRILFSSRPNYKTQPGGDTLHMEQSALALEKLGHTVKIWAGEKVNKQEYDLIHHFNLGRPAQALKLLSLETPMLISTIYVDYQKHEEKSSPFRRFLIRGLGSDALEYLKLMARALRQKEDWPSWYYLFNGHRASIEKLIQKSSLLITASEAEAGLLQEKYPIRQKPKCLKLGVEHLKIVDTKVREGLLCIARFEPLKNQLNLIEALKNSDYRLSLVGEASSNHQDYLKFCQSRASKNMQFLGRVSIDQCAELYAQAKVHVLPSYYESTGLVSIEALASGCQIVVNDHPIQRELFQDRAHYCQVEDPNSILQAVEQALADTRDHQAWLRSEFSWEKSAQKLEQFYMDILSS